MATWHQSKARKRNPAPLYHATQWTVLSDPPGAMASSMTFGSEAEAAAYVERRKTNGTGTHLLVLKPASAG